MHLIGERRVVPTPLAASHIAFAASWLEAQVNKFVCSGSSTKRGTQFCREILLHDVVTKRLLKLPSGEKAFKVDVFMDNPLLF